MQHVDELREYGRARHALFTANEAWLQAGKPENGPVAEEWHRSREQHSQALAALNKIADLLVGRAG